ncbi:MAG: imidazole glycerol phosphate synthase subunit HisH [Tuberibacillus sp.]
MIGIVDYGMGNVASLRNALQHLGFEAVITDNPSILESATHIILPGVGSFKAAVQEIEQRGLRHTLIELAKVKPFLGICLGMQLLFTKGTEGGDSNGLNLIPGTVEKIQTAYVLPHIGWNALDIVSDQNVFGGFQNQFVYFVHSFVAVTDPKYIIAQTEYGTVVPAIVRKNNIYGMQFHPEKSGEVGLTLLQTFLGEGAGA